MQYIFWVANTPEPIYTGSTSRKSDKRVIWAFDVKLGYRAYQSSCALIITWRCTGNLNYHVCKCWLMSYAPKALTEFEWTWEVQLPAVCMGETAQQKPNCCFSEQLGYCSYVTILPLRVNSKNAVLVQGCWWSLLKWSADALTSSILSNTRGRIVIQAHWGDGVNASKSGAGSVECKERVPCWADLTTWWYGWRIWWYQGEYTPPLSPGVGHLVWSLPPSP